MKKINLQVLGILLFAQMIAFAQNTDSISSSQTNSVEKMLSEKPGLGIGGYGEVHYNQPFTKDLQQLGTLDVHRMVLFFGYNYSPKTQFITEIEMEYTKELWVEQAFLQHKLHKYINFRSGLLLVPMGIINEYHEPTTFNGVERPIIDNKIAPSTWREVGAGFSGNIQPIYVKYQAYLIGGLNGYDTKGVFTGAQPLRDGRQKGSKSYISSPNFTAKIDFYGINNLSIGLSYFGGKSQSQLYKNVHKDSVTLLQKADSSIIGINMIGADLRYSNNGFQISSQFYYTALSNTEQYNQFTRIGNVNNTVGKSLMGYYAELGYNVMHIFKKCKTSTIVFSRYETYNLHNSVDNVVTKNEAFNNQIITSGITVHLTKGAVLKTDLQLMKSKTDNTFSKTANFGVGITF